MSSDMDTRSWYGTRSADGRWWWDGARWQPMPHVLAEQQVQTWRRAMPEPRKGSSPWKVAVSIAFLAIGGLISFAGVAAFLGGVDLHHSGVQLFFDLMVSVIGSLFVVGGVFMLRGATKR